MFKKIEVAIDRTFELMPSTNHFYLVATACIERVLRMEKTTTVRSTRAYKIIRCNNCQSSPDS